MTRLRAWAFVPVLLAASLAGCDDDTGGNIDASSSSGADARADGPGSATSDGAPDAGASDVSRDGSATAMDVAATDAAADAAVASLSFSEIAYPVTDVEKRALLASSGAIVKGTQSRIGFNTLLRSGDKAGTGTFGLLYKADGTPLTAMDGSPRISDDNDHSTLIDVQGKLFMVSQFESRPGAYYITELSQSATDGRLTAVSTKPIDLSALGGGWVHCAGTRTPWKSHLGSEEYEPDARLINPVTGVKVLPKDEVTIDTYYGAMADYFGGDATKVKPYRYGYPLEVKVTGPDLGAGTFAGNVTATKHYAMGRFAFELAYVMPDKMTAYMSDDGAMVGMFMFKATTAEDLTAGTLYAAKLQQTSATNGGSFNITWISLGAATEAEIKAFIDKDLTFADLFDAVSPTLVAVGDAGAAPTGTGDGGASDAAPVAMNYTCPAGYQKVSHGHEALAGNSFNECLKLQTTNSKGMTAAEIEKAASRLETRRYAAFKGATLELNKEEGITFDPDRRKLYISMSDVTNGMKDNTAGTTSATEAFSANDIHIAENRCGTVYEISLDASYQGTSMTALLSGVATTYPAGTFYAGNTCDINGLANPDNLTYIPGHGVLIIGEDSGTGHQNDLVWALDLNTKKLTRILSTPYGSEVTSPFIYPNINGWGYLMTVAQHPYGESDSDKTAVTSPERRAYTGFIGPFPKLD